MNGDSWKVTLPCTKAESEALTGEIMVPEGFDEPPLLSTNEPDAHRPDQWLFEAYLDTEPTEAQLRGLLALVPSARREDVSIEHLPAQDWVTLSQQNLKPITAGRFHVYTEAHAHTLLPDQIGLRIEAGQAFGTGQHETTAGCLTMLDELAVSRRFDNALDLGTGSGILALAIAKRWRGALVVASDIDPVSIEVAEENVGVNGERVGTERGMIELVVADGTSHPRLLARAPYDLIVANILAGPLIELASDITSILAPGGTVMLAGLLAEQADDVASAYIARDCRLVARHDVGDWPTLVLRKR